MSRPSSTSLAPTARQLWARARGLLLAAAVLAVAGVIVAALRSGDDYGLLDPRSTAGHGSKATARLLEERGVDIRTVTTAADAAKAAGPDTTLLVSDPDALTTGQRTELQRASAHIGRTLLVAPGPAATTALVPDVRAAAPTAAQPTPPDCDLPAAERAGDTDLGGIRYATSSDRADLCYLRQGLPTLLRLPRKPSGSGERHRAENDTVLLGTPEPLYNRRLAEHGNASLMLQLLGSRPHLVWYLPSSSDALAAEEDRRGFLDLVPAGWTWATVQLAVAAVLAALWRARRLGPLVPEQLPVSVRASETTEGRARLYRRTDARDRAADALRSATRTRLAAHLGVPAAETDSPEALVSALAACEFPQPAAGRPDFSDSAHLRSLLFGPAPATDTELVRLADDLDRLERHLTETASAHRLPTDKERTP